MGENEIKFDTKNYRTHDDKNKKLILKSLKKCGAGRSILIDKQGEIIAGNGVYEQAKNLNIPVKIIETDGSELIAIKRTDLDTESKKRKELALADNSTSDNVTWDLSNLKADFDLSELPEWGLEGLVEVEQLDPEITEDEVPSNEQVETRVKRGDIWKLGEHRLMCGDSTVITDVAKLMNGEKADMVFTDPPYLMGFEGNVHADGSKSHNAKFGPIKNDKMSREDGDQFILDIFTVIKEFCNGAYYVSFYRLGLDYIFRALDKLNNKYKSLIIWNKGVHTLSNSDYMSKYEPIVYGWFNEHKFYGDRSNFDIWDIQRTQKNDLHPTMKPVALVAKAIQNSSKRGGLVLDLFGGSGTSIIASEQTGRKCYTMELDEHYCDVILQRYINFKGSDADVFLLKDGKKIPYSEAYS